MQNHHLWIDEKLNYIGAGSTAAEGGVDLRRCFDQIHDRNEIIKGLCSMSTKDC